MTGVLRRGPPASTPARWDCRGFASQMASTRMTNLMCSGHAAHTQQPPVRRLWVSGSLVCPCPSRPASHLEPPDTQPGPSPSVPHPLLPPFVRRGSFGGASSAIPEHEEPVILAHASSVHHSCKAQLHKGWANPAPAPLCLCFLFKGDVAPPQAGGCLMAACL